MLVPADVWPWLRAEAGLDGGKPARGGMVELPAAVGDAIMSGQVVAKILAGRVAELGDPGGNPTAEARLLKQVAAQRSAGPGGGAAPSERLYSWNLLSPVLARLRVGLSDDDKTLIVAGDEEVRLRAACPCLSRCAASAAMSVLVCGGERRCSHHTHLAVSCARSDDCRRAAVAPDCGQRAPGAQKQASGGQKQTQHEDAAQRLARRTGRASTAAAVDLHFPARPPHARAQQGWRRRTRQPSRPWRPGARKLGASRRRRTCAFASGCDAWGVLPRAAVLRRRTDPLGWLRDEPRRRPSPRGRRSAFAVPVNRWRHPTTHAHVPKCKQQARKSSHGRRAASNPSALLQWI